jgi:hypothetical protein
MAHKIDFSDENMFSSRGMHPLTFLTIPERIYRLMAKDSGKPNRKLIGDYREQMQRLGYESKIFATAVLGRGPLNPYKEHLEKGVDYTDATVSLINQIRPNLALPYSGLPDPELAVTGAFLVTRKPERVRNATNTAGIG